MRNICAHTQPAQTLRAATMLLGQAHLKKKNPEERRIIKINSITDEGRGELKSLGHPPPS